MSTVCVIGLGYIGLPVAAMLASRDHEVFGYDINPRAVESIQRGQAHFFEPDLDMLLQAAVQTGKLKAQGTPAEAEYFIIAVPTPIKNDKTPDLSYVAAATQAIAPFLKPTSTVILESTCPIGTTEWIARRLEELRPDLTFPRYNEMPSGANIAIAHCPERILPGNIVCELVANDRVIGGLTSECAKRAAKLYGSFVSNPPFLTDCRMAEFVKLIENSFRDLNIAFANELSIIPSTNITPRRDLRPMRASKSSHPISCGLYCLACL